MSELLSIIIDRVGSTNVFNIVQGRLPARETHLQSVVDDDLIQEFLVEVQKLSRFSNSLGDSERAAVDIPGMLRKIGETFFLQFFPEQIQERLRTADQSFLFLHVDHRLRSVPWELLHDGRHFLAEHFYMGKNVSGFWRDTARPERERLRVLIVADPTEDLEWARAEGEALFESLNAEMAADRIDVQILSGRSITKLGLLNALKDRDLVHYAGHLHFSPDARESGWLLSEGKVLRAREIEKAGYAPDLVFSNSCFSSPAGPGSMPEKSETRLNDMAGAFLSAGIYNYVGTNWEIKDSRHTVDFAINFYRAIFDGKAVGEALFEARDYARRNSPPTDLTWANYVLHGNPLSRIYRPGTRRTFDASRTMQNIRRVLSRFPYPPVRAYTAFEAAAAESPDVRLARLVDAVDATLHTMAAFVFANGRYLNIKGLEEAASLPLEEKVKKLYETLSTIQAVQFELAVGGVMEPLLLHKDNVHKLLNWRREIQEGNATGEAADTYLVTMQYYLDNFLVDLLPISRGQLYYVEHSLEKVWLLQGARPLSIPLAAGDIPRSIREAVERMAGQVLYYAPARSVLFSLSGFLDGVETLDGVRMLEPDEGVPRSPVS